QREIELAPCEPAKSIARHIALNAANGCNESGLVQPHSTWTRRDMVSGRAIASIKKERLAGDDVGPLPEVQARRELRECHGSIRDVDRRRAASVEHGVGAPVAQQSAEEPVVEV